MINIGMEKKIVLNTTASTTYELQPQIITGTMPPEKMIIGMEKKIILNT